VKVHFCEYNAPCESDATLIAFLDLPTETATLFHDIRNKNRWKSTILGFVQIKLLRIVYLAAAQMVIEKRFISQDKGVQDTDQYVYKRKINCNSKDRLSISFLRFACFDW